MDETKLKKFDGTKENSLTQGHYLTALHEATLQMMGCLNVNDLLKIIIEQACSLSGADHGYIYIISEDSTYMEIRLVAGAGIFMDSVGRRISRGQGLAGRVWQTVRPLKVDDYRSWPHRLLDHADYNLLHANLALPLKSGGQLIGILGLAYLDPERTLYLEDVKLFSNFAELASIALHNARLYTVAQQELAERQHLQNQLFYLSTHDYLTGLPNRRAMEERLALILKQAHQNDKGVLMFIDLDHFKEINDSTPLGHDAGDQALKHIAELLGRRLRSHDMLARIGGDEFVILLEHTAPSRAEQIARRLHATIASQPFDIADHRFNFTLSIGMVVLDSQENARTVLYQADTAMYVAKRQGGNQVVMFRSELQGH